MNTTTERGAAQKAVPRPEERPRAKRRRTYWSADRALSIAIVTPSIIAIAIFVYGFIGWSLRVSMSEWDRGLTPRLGFAGLEHYLQLFQDRRFVEFGLRNTLVFTVLFLAACLAIGLFLAIMLDQRIKGEGFFRSIFLFPMAISFIVTGVAWRWLMNPSRGRRASGLNLLFGMINLGKVVDFVLPGPAPEWMYDIGMSQLADKLPSLFNLGKVVDAILPGPAPVWMYDVGLQNVEISRWFTNSAPWGIAFVVIPAVWQMSGFTMALYLGGLRSISDDLREAARVDGASEFQIYRYIILPLLRPVTLSAMIVLGHISLKIFDLVYVIGLGDLSLDVPSVYMWRTIFEATNYAQGAAIGILMLLMIAVLIIPYLVYSMRSETEL